MPTPVQLRAELEDLVVRELLGPRRSTVEDGNSDDVSIPTDSLTPSSIGLSCTVAGDTKTLLVTARWLRAWPGHWHRMRSSPRSRSAAKTTQRYSAAAICYVTAPRVTPQQIEDVIACEYHFTADKATQDCLRRCACA